MWKVEEDLQRKPLGFHVHSHTELACECTLCPYVCKLASYMHPPTHIYTYTQENQNTKSSEQEHLRSKTEKEKIETVEERPEKQGHSGATEAQTSIEQVVMNPMLTPAGELSVMGAGPLWESGLRMAEKPRALAGRSA